jgi:glucose 1-dehydrogenase
VVAIAATALLPVSIVLGTNRRAASAIDPLLARTITAGGLTAIVVAVYLAVVLGLGRVPRHDERTLLALSMVAAVVERFGGIDVLVNNAGIEKQVPTLEMPLDLWEAVLRTNLTGAFLCLREAGKHMAAQKSGVVVNMSSVHEFIPWPGFAHYCASKGGMKLLTQTVAREWAPLGIRCVNVAPGAIATPINDFVLNDPEAKHAVEEEIPLGRFGQPEEIAGVVAWVASDQGGYVTGTTLVVDGGMSTYPKFI